MTRGLAQIVRPSLCENAIVSLFFVDERCAIVAVLRMELRILINHKEEITKN